ncbi:MAG: hypothetical protein BAJALOKI3v1_90076 [Promethearchaeota archaeon]|nr:MAG: hypothetical protein BAJALOKI3v1_90076 [Candidatus Lokiarchaeota archaeon]
MAEEEKNNKIAKEENEDYQVYLNEIAELQSDYSDLEELDMEEIEDMKKAISQVKEVEQSGEALEVLEEEEPMDEVQDTLESKEEMLVDFSDLGKMDLEELMQMKQAVDTVKQEETLSQGKSDSQKPTSSLSDDIEKRIQEELREKKKEEEQREATTEDDFLDYIQDKRDKIWYHALYYLAFEVEDHTASKNILYEMLKDDTSKSAINPIPEHQFYFGLGYILRLKINQEQVVRYVTGGSFKINYDITTIQEILEKAGDPIITKPQIEEEKKKRMFREFLEEDFSEF